VLEPSDTKATDAINAIYFVLDIVVLPFEPAHFGGNASMKFHSDKLAKRLHYLQSAWPGLMADGGIASRIYLRIGAGLDRSPT